MSAAVLLLAGAAKGGFTVCRGAAKTAGEVRSRLIECRQQRLARCSPDEPSVKSQEPSLSAALRSRPGESGSTATGDIGWSTHTPPPAAAPPPQALLLLLESSPSSEGREGGAAWAPGTGGAMSKSMPLTVASSRPLSMESR